MAHATTQTETPDSGPNLLEALSLLPDEFEVSGPAGQLEQLIRDEIEKEMKGGELTWIGTSEAVEHFDDLNSRTLRRRAKQWKKIQEEGRRPPVRVTKKTDAPNSDWLFCEEDCRRKGSDREASARQSTPPGELPSTPADESSGPGDEGSDENSVDLGGLEDELPI